MSRGASPAYFLSLFLLHLFFFSCIFFVWTVENGGFDRNKKRGFYFVPKAMFMKSKRVKLNESE